MCNNRQLSTASLAAKCIQFLEVLRTARMLALSLQLVPIVARARQPKWPLQSVRRKHCISTNCEQLLSCFLSFNQLQKQYNTAACNLAPERKRMKANTPATDLNYIANYKCIGVLVLPAFLLLQYLVCRCYINEFICVVITFMLQAPRRKRLLARKWIAPARAFAYLSSLILTNKGKQTSHFGIKFLLRQIAKR